MTTIATLVAATPAPTRGVPAGFTYGTGVWRHVVELADPAAGSSVEWFDITESFTGYEYTRGADSYQGRYRASVATLDLFAPDDRYAPWNDDTTDTFGVNVSLGPGLLIRSGFILVAGGVVTEWNPRFTCKVEFWGDASYSQGKIRQHRIVARDTLTSLVGVPIGASVMENWSDRVDHVLTEAGWEYGYTLYGATTIGGVGVLPLPARDPQVSAINELDVTVDPAGATWYTNRKGQLIVRPTVYDTWQAGRFTAGAAGTPYPEPDPVTFSWWSCSGETPPGDYGDLDTALTAAYALDTRGIDPFGLDRSEQSVINHVIVDSPSGTFDDDDPTSIQRYDRHTLQASWITANDFVAADILAARANATIEARPLTATVRLEQFHPGPATVDYLDDLDIWHRNGDAGMEVNANGWLRSYRELVRPSGCDTDWSLVVTFDVFESTSRAPFLLPVTNLELAAVTDTVATFTWGNPTQAIAPTHTQIRMDGPTSAWTTTAYPITGVIWSALTPYTPYEFEVRLIRVVDSIITHFSPIRSVVFITDDPTVPDVTVDPDVPDTVDVVFPPPDPDDPTCILEWELQSSPDGLDPWTTEDDGEITAAPYDLNYDTSALDPGVWYRFRSREVCGGIPDAWQYSDPFVVGCIPVTQLGVAPFDDADLVAYWPEVCPPDTISEAVSGEPMILGGAFDRVGFDSAGLPVMYTYGEGVIGFGSQPVAVAGSSDLTIACRVNFGELPAVESILFGYGGLYLSAVPSGSGYVVQAQCLEAGVGTISLASASVQDIGTEYTLTITHDVGGTLSLYVDDNLEDASVSTVGARGGTLGGLYQIGGPADSWITDCAVWDTVLAPVGDLPVTFVYTGAFETWVVPTGVTTITVDAYGAEGGGEYAGVTLKGKGGRVQCDVTVTPGETLRVYVGQQGATASSITDDPGPSFNGGGAGANGAGAGGGRTDIRRSPYAAADRLVVAPGGGGAGCNNGQITTGGGGNGGTPNGANGQAGIAGPQAGAGAAGATPGAGGSSNGTSGDINGDGGNGGNQIRGGGGAGGGRAGGGGGGSGGSGTAGGGGGGGSGLSTGVNETIVNGTRTGNGELTVSF